VFMGNVTDDISPEFFNCQWYCLTFNGIKHCILSCIIVEPLFGMMMADRQPKPFASN
jgi:hypothetical protein